MSSFTLKNFFYSLLFKGQVWPLIQQKLSIVASVLASGNKFA